MFFTTLVSSVSDSSSQLFTNHMRTIELQLMHCTSVEYCPINRAKPRGVRSYLLQCLQAYISAVLVYPKHVLLGTWPVIIHNRNVILNSCRCLAVRRWSINVLLAFNQAAPNGIWVDTSSEKEHNHKKKPIIKWLVFVFLLNKNEDNDCALCFGMVLTFECLQCVWLKL